MRRPVRFEALHNSSAGAIRVSVRAFSWDSAARAAANCYWRDFKDAVEWDRSDSESPKVLFALRTAGEPDGRVRSYLGTVILNPQIFVEAGEAPPVEEAVAIEVCEVPQEGRRRPRGRRG